MADTTKKDTYIVELEAVIDQSFKDLIKVLDTSQRELKEMQKAVAVANAEFASSGDVDAYGNSLSKTASSAKTMSGAMTDAERSIDSYNKELARQVSIANTLPQKLANITSQLERMKAAGQTSGAQWQVLNAEMARLADTQRKLDAASAGNVESFKQVRGGIQNASYQVTDFIVQVQGGQDALRAFGQQAPQLLSGFGAWGAAIGLVVTGITAMVAAFRTADTAKPAIEGITDALKVLKEASANTSAQLTLVDTQVLVEQFNKADYSTRLLTLSLIEANQALAFTSLKEAEQGVKKLGDEIQNVAGIFKQLQGKTTSKELFGDFESIEFNSVKLKNSLNEVANGQLSAADAALKWREGLIRGNTELSKSVIKTLDELSKAQTEYGINSKKTADLIVEMRAKINDPAGVTDPKEIAKAAKDLADEKDKLAKQTEQANKAERKSVEALMLQLERKNESKLTEIETIQRYINEQVALHKNYEKEIRLAGEVAIANTNAAEAQKAYSESLKELAIIQKEVNSNDVSNAKKQQEDTDAAIKRIEEMETAYKKSIGTINDATIAQDEYNKTLEDIAGFKDVYTDEELKRLEDIAKATYEAKLGVLDYAQAIKKVGDEMANSFGKAMDDLIDSFGESKFSFNDMIESMLLDLAKLLNQILIIEPFIKAIKGFDFGSLFGSSAQIAGGGTYYIPEETVSMARSSANTYVGGTVTGSPQGSTMTTGNTNNAGVSVVINNNAPVEVTTTASTDVDGVTQLNIMIDRQVKSSMANGIYDRQMRNSYGLSRNPMP